MEGLEIPASGSAKLHRGDRNGKNSGKDSARNSTGKSIRKKFHSGPGYGIWRNRKPEKRLKAGIFENVADLTTFDAG